MEARVSRLRTAAEDIYELVLRLPSALEHKPGQYVMLSFPGDDESRAYSIVRGGKEMTIYFKGQGSFTSRMVKVRKGDTIKVRGPYGRFVLPPGDARIVLVAGGIGITPLYAMAAELESTRAADAVLFYSARTRASMALLDEISRFRHVKVHLRATREGDQRVDAESIMREVPELGAANVFLCGPPVMIENFRTQLTGLGLPPERIWSEDFNGTA